MRQKTRQYQEEQLQRIEQQRDDTRRKLRALDRQAQQEQLYRCGEYVELAGLAHLDPGTLLGGLYELATMLTDPTRAAHWKALGDTRLEEHHRHRAHRRRAAAPTTDGMSPRIVLKAEETEQS